MNEVVPKEHWIATKADSAWRECEPFYICMFTSKAGACSDSFKRQQVVTGMPIAP
jgi:hypothetical protein